MFIGAITLFVLMVYGGMVYALKSGIDGIRTKEIVQPNEYPAIAVIVSFKNEALNVDECVAQLFKLEYPKGLLEFVFVDDNSTDATFEILKKYQLPNVKLLKNNGNGKKQAIELAVDCCNSEWVAVTDADCLVPSSWLLGMVGCIKKGSQMVLGPVFIENSGSFLSRLQAIEFLGLQGTTAGSAGINVPLSANAANMVFKKSSFLETTPYDNNYHLKTGDDMFLLMAISSRFKNGVNYAMSEFTVVKTKPVTTWESYLKQRTRWASKGSAYTDKKIQLVGVIVFLVNVLVILSFFYGILNHNWKLSLLPLLFKLSVELVLINPMKKLANENLNYIMYLVSGLLYPLVVVYTVISGLFKRK